MVSEEIFDNCMMLLMSHFEKQLQPVVLGMWREEIDSHLNSEEMSEATRKIILYFEPRYRGHFPTVKNLLDVVNGTKEAKALEEWQIILTAASRQNESQLAYLSQRAHTALRAIGGLNSVGLADEYKRDRLEQSFVKVYCQCAEKSEKALPPVPTASPQEQRSEEYAPMPTSIKQQIEQLKHKKSMARS